MKKTFMLAACLLLVAAARVGAQTAAQPPAGPRDLFNTHGKAETAPAAPAAAPTAPAKGRPGARLRIELDRGGRVRWVSTKTVFQAGDKVRFHFAMNFPGYVVIINEGSSGKRSLLFPYEGVSNRVGRTADYTVPQGEAWFQFDETAGEERLTFIMSKREIQEVTQLTTAGAHPSATTTPVGGGSGGAHAPAASGNGGTSAASAPASTPANTAASAPAAPQTEEQEILAALNSRALGGGRDLKLVEESSDGYVLTSDEALAKPVGFRLTLKHR
jgi:hypothetical protein